MTSEELNTTMEQTILEAAEKVFSQKGKEGTSMQDIADEAKITRTSLNYYYRTKDKLFEAVFKNIMGRFVPRVGQIMNGGFELEKSLPEMVSVIIDAMIENPHIPLFVLSELQSDPARMPVLMRELGVDFYVALKSMEQDPILQKHSMDPRHLLMNVIGQSIFPFAARPVVINLLYAGDQAEFLKAMEERKRLIPAMIQNLIKSS